MSEVCSTVILLLPHSQLTGLHHPTVSKHMLQIPNKQALQIISSDIYTKSTPLIKHEIGFLEKECKL